jgi:hypothetical protein
MLKKTQSLPLIKIGWLIVSEKKSAFVPTNIQRTRKHFVEIMSRCKHYSGKYVCDIIIRLSAVNHAVMTTPLNAGNCVLDMRVYLSIYSVLFNREYLRLQTLSNDRIDSE